MIYAFNVHYVVGFYAPFSKYLSTSKISKWLDTCSRFKWHICHFFTPLHVLYIDKSQNYFVFRNYQNVHLFTVNNIAVTLTFSHFLLVYLISGNMYPTNKLNYKIKFSVEL